MKIIDTYRTIVVGTGCAGYGAADCLYDKGITDIAILTENRVAGTSRNAGSDKQTYYKMSLSGDEGDCPIFMAKTLFEGGAMDGDTALVEAATSVKAFMKLEGLGVLFPKNEFGEFVGYKTDHDPYSRASSVGPYTSKEMTEALEKSVMHKGIPVLSGYQVIKLSVENKKITGLYAIQIDNLQDDYGLVFFSCENIIMATGGPAIVYKSSVFPVSHTGASSLMLEAGVRFANAAEWQYGIASTKFRWNLSGTYQQVLPRYYSLDENGQEYEFLNDYYENPLEAVNNCFLKGYQWPFDSKKANQSSRIDLLVHQEISVNKRRVFMDFTRNPSILEKCDLSHISEEAYTYLQNSDALQELPIQRLMAMNPKAYELYMDHNIDLAKEPLEIAVCAQHNNGGAEVDIHYQTNIQGIFAAGECACTLGIIRPGGTALNSSQVAGIRIAEYLACRKSTYTPSMPKKNDCDNIRKFIQDSKGISTIRQFRTKMQSIMTECFAFKRDIDDMKKMLPTYYEAYRNLSKLNRWERLTEIPSLFKNCDMLITQLAYGESILHSSICSGSRGGALVVKDENELTENTDYRNIKIQTTYSNGQITITKRPVRPIPAQRDLWFEIVWRKYFENMQ